MLSRTPVFADGLQHYMDMRMSFIGMQGEGVPVLTPEFLTREVSHRSQHLARWHSGRHREQEFMDELARTSAFGGGEGCLTPHVVDVEVPVAQQRLTDPTAQALTVIGFQFQLSVAPDVVEVFAHGLEVAVIARQHLYDCLRGSLDGPPDLLYLCRRKPTTRLAGASATVGDQIEKRLTLA
ncbi:MAG: hypothetical protein WA446_20115 [Steroidobacteraceae bacterium]